MTQNSSADVSFGEGPEAHRRELERRAYGRAGTPEQMRDALLAQEALETLDRHSLAASLATDNADQAVAALPSTPPSGSSEPDFDPNPARPSRRPQIVVLAVIAALIVGIVLGRTSATLHFSSDMAGAQSPTAPSPNASANARLFSASAPTAVSISADLAVWFSAKQTPEDIYPYPASPFLQASYDPGSTRLVASSTVLGKVWVAKRTKPRDGVCLISQSVLLADDSMTGTMGCAGTATFARAGLSVTNANLSIDWTLSGIQFGQSQ
jgi:hypothetical protein